MKKITGAVIFFGFLCFGFLCTKAICAGNFPPAPAGYTWKLISGMEAAFLMPDHWHYIRQDGKDAVSFAISKESAIDRGSFDTGFTVQIMKNVPEKQGVLPSVFAISMAQGVMSGKGNTVLSSHEFDNGPFKGFGLRYRNAPGSVSPVIIHQVYFGNDQTGTLWIITFEAPEDKWEADWAVGEVIVKRMMLDDEF